MKKKYKELVHNALQIACDLGCSDAEAQITLRNEMDFELRNGMIDTVSSAATAALFIDLYVEGRHSFVRTNRMDLHKLRPLLDESVRGARFLTPDPAAMLLTKEESYAGTTHNFGLNDPLFRSIAHEEKESLARNLAAQCDDTSINSLKTSYSDYAYSMYRANTKGFTGERASTYYAAVANVAALHDGVRTEACKIAQATRFYDLDISDLGKKTQQLALDKFDKRKIASGEHTIIMSKNVASRFVDLLMDALSGESLLRNSSFLIDSIGKKIASNKLTLWERPRRRGVFGARAFDSENAPTFDMPIIEKGVLKNYYISHYDGRRLGMVATTGEPIALSFSTSQLTEDQIVAAATDALYIVGMTGGNCNDLTGDFSYGIEGYVIKQGMKCGYFSEALLTGNWIALFNELAEVSADVDFYSVPAMLFNRAIVNV